MAYWTIRRKSRSTEVISFDFLWMTPAAYAMLAGVLAIPASIVRSRTGRWPAALVVTLLVWFGMCGWLRVGAKSVQPLAAIVLALGIGVQVGRFAARTRLWRRTVDLLTPVVFLATLYLAGVAFVVPKWREHQALKALPAASAQAPNVLLIVLDPCAATR